MTRHNSDAPIKPFQKSEADPIDYIDGKWGHWDETWSYFHAVGDSEEAARKGLKLYCILHLDTLESTLFKFFEKKYVQRADERQKNLGLQYTEAETNDLAREVA